MLYEVRSCHSVSLRELHSNMSAGNAGLGKMKAWLVDEDYEVADDADGNAGNYEMKAGRS